MSTFVTSVAIFNSSPSDSNVILFESLSGSSFCSLGANPSKLLSLTLPPINWWGSYIRRLPDYSKANQTNLFLQDFHYQSCLCNH